MLEYPVEAMWCNSESWTCNCRWPGHACGLAGSQKCMMIPQRHSSNNFDQVKDGRLEWHVPTAAA